MSANDYAGKGTLPPELEERVHAELSGGERLVWLGQPRPDLYRGQTIFLSIFGAFFGGIALVMFLVGVGMAVAFAGFGGAAAGNAAGTFAGCFPLFFCLFTIPFMLIGGYLLFAPWWMPKRIRRILYALTDRRAVVFEPNWFGGGYTVRSYTREGLGRMYRVDRAGDAGDLVFEEYYTTSTNSEGYASSSRTQRGFMGIDRVREVEELVRLTLMG
jgi:hypothetical protein